MRRVIVVFVLLAGGLGGLLAWRLREQARAEEAPPGSSGVVEGTRVVVSARMAGRILRMNAAEGDAVQAGAVLAEMDCAEADAAVAEADARVAAGRAQVRAAKAQRDGARAQARAAGAQAEAVALQARAARGQADGAQAQIGSVRAQRDGARLQRERAAELVGQNIAAESDLERARTGEEALGWGVDAARAAARAATAAADAVERQSTGVAAQAAAADAQAAGAEALIEGAEKQLAAGEAAAARIRVMQAECRVTAPRAGVVALRAREPGEVVLPGSTLYEIRDDAEMTVTFYVANADLSRADVGTRVDVVADAYPGERFGGVVKRVSEEAEFTPRTVQTRSDRERLVYAVEARVENPRGRLRAGMPVEVTLAGQAR